MGGDLCSTQTMCPNIDFMFGVLACYSSFKLLPFPSTVIDHGIASVELVMEEALQDIPTLVHDIQERLKKLSESVAVDGKPCPGLPNRRLLWDVLKPQASTVS